MNRLKFEARIKIPRITGERLGALRARLEGMKEIEPGSFLTTTLTLPVGKNLAKVHIGQRELPIDGVILTGSRNRQELVDKASILIEVVKSAGVELFNLEVVRNLRERRDDTSAHKFAGDFPELFAVEGVTPFRIILWGGRTWGERLEMSRVKGELKALVGALPEHIIGFMPFEESSFGKNFGDSDVVRTEAAYYAPDIDTALRVNRVLKNSGQVEKVQIQQVCLVAASETIIDEAVLVAAIGRTLAGKFEFDGKTLRFQTTGSDLFCEYDPANKTVTVKGDPGETVLGVPKRFLDALSEAWMYCSPRGFYIRIEQKLKESIGSLRIMDGGSLSS